MKSIKLNSIQYKFWLDNLLKYPSVEYNDTNFTFVVNGALSISRLKESYKRIMQEYPPFHSHIKVEERIPYFIPDEEINDSFFSMIEVSPSEDVEILIHQYVRQPFHLEKQYPCRFYAFHRDNEYFLLHVFHHVIMDGWTLKQFFNKLSEVYHSLQDGYSVTESMSQWTDSFGVSLDKEYNQKKEDNIHYWEELMCDMDIQTDIPHVKSNTTHSISHHFSLGSKWHEKVLAVCKAIHTTPFRMYISAWALTLSRISRTDQLLVDHTLNLCPPQQQPFMGVFVNNLPLKFDFTHQDSSFAQLLAQVRQRRHEETEHQCVFYHDIFHQSAIAPLQKGGVNISFSYPAKYNSMQLSLDKCTVTPYGHIDLEVSSDLVLVIEDDAELSCNLRHQPHFSSEFISSLAMVWSEILKQVVTEPDILLRDIHLLPSQEQTLLLNKEDDMLHKAAPAESFLSHFKYIARTYADKPAIEVGQEHLSYAELDRLSNQVASGLISNGWHHQRIGLSSIKNTALIVALLGIMKSGNTYVPIDYSLPQERIDFMISDCQLVAILTTHQTPVTPQNIPVLLVETMMDTDGGPVVAVNVRPSDEAYIIYTSGTTGKPKAIPILHSMLNQMIINHLDIQQISGASRVMQFSNISFDASIFEIFPVLNGGGTLVLPHEEDRKDPHLLYQFLSDKQISIAYIPPVILSVLPHQPLPGLHTILVGGDTCPLSVLKYWSQGRNVINAYGPTENTVDTTCLVVGPDSEKNDIGTSEPGVTCYVLDQNRHLVPNDVIGELYVGGVKLTTGYIHRPQQNQEHFFSNPFVSEADRKEGQNLYLYKTGDLVMRRKNGHLVFIGRSDFQVKLHGYRIELGDVETKIGEYGKDIKGVSVQMCSLGHNQQLVAYVQVDNADTFSDRGLRQYLKLHLPAYMIPSFIIPLKEFPYNASGKIDRKRLPHPASVTSVIEEKKELQTPTEQQLASLWEELLPGKTFGRDDDFISSGGDSLAIIQLSFSIEEKWRIDIKASDIYQNTTLQHLAGWIDQHIDTQQSSEQSADRATAGNNGKLPLSPTQLSLWLQCVQADEIKDTYNLPCLFFCPQETTPQRFAFIFNRLVENQESFRMFFPIGNDGKPYIQITPFNEIKIECYEVSSTQLNTALQEDLKTSFNLTHGPLFRVKLYHVDNHQYCCSLVMHHLISDGWSASIIERTISQYLSGNEIEWNRNNVSYLDYVQEAIQFKESAAYSSRLDYWKKNLADVSDLGLLLQKQRTSKDFGGESYVCPFPQGLSRKVKDFCHAHTCTAFNCYSFVYLLLLARLSQQTDFAIGFPYLGREQGKYNPIVGYFVKILPLCYHSRYSNLTFSQYISTMHKSMVEAESNAIALDEILQPLREENGNQSLQLIQTLFTYEQKGLLHECMKTEHTDFSLIFSVVYSDSGDACYLKYQHDCFHEPEIRSLVNSYFALLESVIENPDIQLGHYPLVSPEYQHNIVQSNSCSSAQDKEQLSFLQRFAQTAQTMPGHTAIIFKDESVSYAQLDAMSNQIRDVIQSAHIQAPATIAVHMVASIRSMAIILGILKAGCTYVPIDVSFPPERRDFILHDASCSMIFDEEHDTHGRILRHGPAHNVCSDQTAYIIYTSGTTGIPKGVPIPHRALSHFITSIAGIYGLTPDTRYLLFASISFDGSVVEIFPSLSVGATLVIAAPEERKDPSLLFNLLQRQKVSCGWVPPAMLLLLPKKPLPSLSTLIVAGESSEPSVLQYWQKGRTLINAYGPTENTVITTLCHVDEGFEHNDIGLPLPGVSCYVLDKQLNIVPDNMKGDLYIGGLQLTGGYLNRPDLNGEKFIANPYVLPEDKVRGVNTILYKSGDVVMRRPNGHLIFMGRSDRQVKLRGFRIELPDIENHLMQCNGVQRAVVKVQKGKQGDELVAYVQAGPDVKAASLQLILRSQMPGYMVPAKWTIMKEFPLTVNGKTDWRNIPEPQVVMTEQLTPPETEDEQQLLSLVCNIMQTDAIGVETNLFDAGMTSIQVMQFVMEAAGISPHFRFNISSVYRNRTLRRLLQDHGSNLYFWLDPYTPEKPVMVFICGFPYLRPFYDKFVAFFRNKFNIFVFESYHEYFRHKSEISIDILLDHYMQIMNTMLKGKTIFTITGYCAGSEIALRLALRMQQNGQNKPKVLLMEAIRERQKGIPVPHISDVEIIQQNYEITYRLTDTLPSMGHYEGEIIIAFAKEFLNRVYLDREVEEDMELLEAARNESLAARADWQREYPQAPYLEVPASHWTFFDEEPINQVWETMKKNWGCKE